jgi:hypothetical protein
MPRNQSILINCWLARFSLSGELLGEESSDFFGGKRLNDIIPLS